MSEITYKSKADLAVKESLDGTEEIAISSTQKVTTQAIADFVTLNFDSFSKEIVTALPTTDISTNKIYFVPKDTAETNDFYDEYMYINDSWEFIGTTQIDLANYYDKAAVDEMISALEESKMNDFDKEVDAVLYQESDYSTTFSTSGTVSKRNITVAAMSDSPSNYLFFHATATFGVSSGVARLRLYIYYTDGTYNYGESSNIYSGDSKEVDIEVIPIANKEISSIMFAPTATNSTTATGTLSGITLYGTYLGNLTQYINNKIANALNNLDLSDLRTIPLYYYGSGVPTIPTDVVSELPSDWSLEESKVIVSSDVNDYDGYNATNFEYYIGGWEEILETEYPSTGSTTNEQGSYNSFFKAPENEGVYTDDSGDPLMLTYVSKITFVLEQTTTIWYTGYNPGPCDGLISDETWDSQHNSSSSTILYFYSEKAEISETLPPGSYTRYVYGGYGVGDYGYFKTSLSTADVNIITLPTYTSIALYNESNETYKLGDVATYAPTEYATATTKGVVRLEVTTASSGASTLNIYTTD